VLPGPEERPAQQVVLILQEHLEVVLLQLVLVPGCHQQGVLPASCGPPWLALLQVMQALQPQATDQQQPLQHLLQCWALLVLMATCRRCFRAGVWLPWLLLLLLLFPLQQQSSCVYAATLPASCCQRQAQLRYFPQVHELLCLHVAQAAAAAERLGVGCQPDCT